MSIRIPQMTSMMIRTVIIIAYYLDLNYQNLDFTVLRQHELSFQAPQHPKKPRTSINSTRVRIKAGMTMAPWSFVYSLTLANVYAANPVHMHPNNYKVLGVQWEIHTKTKRLHTTSRMRRHCSPHVRAMIVSVLLMCETCGCSIHSGWDERQA